MNRSTAIDAELDDMIDAAVSFGNHPTDTGRGRVHNMVGRWLDALEHGDAAQASVATERVRFELDVELPVTVSAGDLLVRLADYLKARELRVVTTAVETTFIPPRSAA